MRIARTVLGRLLTLQQLLAAVLVAEAFVLSHHRQHQRLHDIGWVVDPKKRTITDTIIAKATIYAPSWEGGDNDDDDNKNNMFSSFNSKICMHPDLAGKISRELVGALARLAVAFSPQGRKLSLRDIEHVEVLNVDENHMDIEAVVCSDAGCVTLAVPVVFPHPCSSQDDGLSECVLSNLDELDVKASEVIRRIEWEEGHHEEIEADRRQLLVLQSTDDLHFPDWWIPPRAYGDRELRSECDSTRRLLNEADFASEVKAMATQALASSPAHEDWMVVQAAVAAVCPAGLLIRASVKQVVVFEESTAVHMLEIPIAFPNATDTADGLHAAILGAVSAAGEFAED